MYGSEWEELAIGQHHTLGVEVGGAVHCLGREDYGRLGLGEGEAGFLISNMEHAAPDTKGQVVLAQERCAAV